MKSGGFTFVKWCYRMQGYRRLPHKRSLNDILRSRESVWSFPNEWSNGDLFSDCYICCM